MNPIHSFEDTVRCLSFVMALTLLTGLSVAAQPSYSDNEWRHGTTVNVSAGAASASSEAGPLVGAAVGWEVKPWLAVEGGGSWLNRETGAEAFAAELTASIGFNHPAPATPFVEVGVGMYRTWFDLTHGSLPDFYRRRLSSSNVVSSVSFTDPSFIVGIGLNVFFTPHLALRPDMGVRLVRGDSQTYLVSALMVHLAYHFEEHPAAEWRW
jgi:hypothetical protein